MPRPCSQGRQRDPPFEGCDTAPPKSFTPAAATSRGRRSAASTLRRVVALSFWLWVHVSATCAANLDDATLAGLPPGTPLRWDNVESAPIWVAGVVPQFDPATNLHLIQLAPGQQATIRLPPRSLVRVTGACGALAPQDVELWVSDGSALFRQLLTAIATNPTSLLAAPDLGRWGLVRIERPRWHGCALRIAVFTSRRIPLECPDYYRCPLEDGGCSVRLSLDAAHEGADFQPLVPGRRGRWSVCGPSRLRVRTRLQYPTGESRQVQPYQLRSWLDGRPAGTLEFETSSEAQHVVYVDGTPRVVGRLEVGYLDIPAGEHTLLLESSACVYLQVAAWNLPPPDPSGCPVDLTAWSRPHGPRVSCWDLTDEEAGYRLRASPPVASAYHELALRSARDNRFRQGGLRAWHLLKTLSAQRPEAPELDDLADDFANFHTFYRNLLPVSSAASLRLRQRLVSHPAAAPGREKRGRESVVRSTLRAAPATDSRPLFPQRLLHFTGYVGRTTDPRFDRSPVVGLLPADVA